ncbi:imidazole glycerol phosphate synthase subunit HisH [Patescibacteria group bacterium]|jgi:glutamine amidotransferase|nr:imidazole glycerol phosphate synthase subunit HisH [Patescibacteria group bacterium]
MIAILDYGMGNRASVQNALAFLGHESVVTQDPAVIAAATHLILPGVGAFGDGMKAIHERGLDRVMADEIAKGKPLLGICLGMQLLATKGEEGGLHDGLGFIPGTVKRLSAGEVRIPHVGWNDVTPKTGEALFLGTEPNVFYFVHSFALMADDTGDIIATCDYGMPFAAAVRRGKIMGVQFHPEKSQASGLRVLKNFLSIT